MCCERDIVFSLTTGHDALSCSSIKASVYLRLFSGRRYAQGMSEVLAIRSIPKHTIIHNIHLDDLHPRIKRKYGEFIYDPYSQYP